MGLSWQQGPLAAGAIGRFLVVNHGDRVVADTTRPLVLCESGFAPRWCVPAADVDQTVVPHGVDRDLTTSELTHDQP